MIFRDKFSCLSHLAGALLALAGIPLLLTRGYPPMREFSRFSFCVFTIAMFLLYLSSALYHARNWNEKTLLFLRRIDHIMIFVFIAATYTPLCMVSLRGPWGWTLLSCQWLLALAGLIFKLLWMKAPRRLYTTIYLLMGWTVLAALPPLVRALTWHGMLWLFIGGLSYTTGAVIYALKKPDPWPGRFGFHEIFHLLILGGSLAHFWTIYRYV